MCKNCTLLLLLLAAALLPARAFAGGFEFPDNGTEALGRGGAFVAKADDGTALEYNIAGFARQPGTRLTLDANLVFHDLAFTRAGVYPGDPNDPRTPYAGMPYPTIHDGNSLFFAPFLAVSTDLGGRLKNVVIAAGIYGPPSVGDHNYGVGAPLAGSMDDPPATVKVGGTNLPSPSRYDVTKTNLLIAYPTLAVAWKPSRILELGFAWQVVLANFDLANANLTPLGAGKCPTPDWDGCDSYARVRAFGTSFSSSSSAFNSTAGQFGPGINTFGWIFSLLLHPVDWIDIGWTLRPQIDVHAEGTVHPVPPPPTTLPQTPGFPCEDGLCPVTFTTTLPAWMRIGGRVVKRYPDGTERADLELDLVWENWAAEQADHLHAEEFKLGKGGQLDAAILHAYRDTFGLRLGGAYNHKLNDKFLLTGRLGLFFDSAATHYAATRLDFNTAAKYGLTVGAGLKLNGFTINLAYAFIYSPDRNVTNSANLAVSGTNGTNFDKGDALIPVGNGLYQASLHIFSLGVTVNFSEVKFKRN
jgi:long-chain fatty acid transport protein